MAVSLQLTGGFVHHVASTSWTGCDGLLVQVLGGRPPDDRMHVSASLCTCAMCALTHLTWVGVYLRVGLLCLSRGLIVMEFVLVWSGLHCFLRLSFAGLNVVLVLGCCWTRRPPLPTSPPPPQPLPPTPPFPAWLPQTLCFLLDRQRCRWPCELTVRGGSPACRCVRTFDGLWRSVCAGTGWSPAW